MILVTFILRRYNREVQTSEMFNTAGRTVKSGLVASAVVSSWTWAATLLQSTGVCYRYGVSGPFWYASGATVQILLFATLAIELKRRAPNAHTYLEIIKARYGTVAHIVFLVFGLATNILVSLMLIVGGSATINALTGMHTIAASKCANYHYLQRKRLIEYRSLPPSSWRHCLHSRRRPQGDYFDRLGPHLYPSAHHHHLLLDDLCITRRFGLPGCGLRLAGAGCSQASSCRQQGWKLSDHAIPGGRHLFCYQHCW